MAARASTSEGAAYTNFDLIQSVLIVRNENCRAGARFVASERDGGAGGELAGHGGKGSNARKPDLGHKRGVSRIRHQHALQQLHAAMVNHTALTGSNVVGCRRRQTATERCKHFAAVGYCVV